MKFLLILITVLTTCAVKAQFVEKWFNQKLDHMDPLDDRTWKMHFHTDESHYQPGGPIFICIGYLAGGAFSCLGSHFMDIGREAGAYMATIGHRYYDKNKPTLDLSVENLKYLTTEQAILDVAELIKFLKTSLELDDAKVILGGIENGARIATWVRLKHPDLVDGVWASSGQYFASEDFPDYHRNIAETLRTFGGETCYRHFVNVFNMTEELFSSGQYHLIEKQLNLCHPFKNEEIANSLLFASLSAVMGIVFQFLGLERALNVCKSFENDENDDLTNYGQYVVNTIYQLRGCFDIDYNNFINEMTIEKWDQSIFEGRLILYQYCFEYGWYKSSSELDLPFGNRFPPEMLYRQCESVFPTIYNRTMTKTGVARTNSIYGGFKPNVTKVYFTNGELDPARSFGILEDLNPESPAVIIPLQGLGKDFKSSKVSDSRQLKEVKQRARSLIFEWLRT